MLISFSLENWMSFRDRVTFSMVASKERQHGERLPKIEKYQMRLLPIAAIYGGNASGKTNFFKALKFAKRLIVQGTGIDKLISVKPFRLDAKMAEEPSRFEFVLLIENTVYEYSFAVTRKAVVEEKLVVITSTSEKVLYHRNGNNTNSEEFFNDEPSLQYAFKGTRDNQLFLTNSVSQKIDKYRPVFDWFKKNLLLIAPDERFEPIDFGPVKRFFDEEHPHYSTINEVLSQLDTGISHLCSERISFENFPIPEKLKTELFEEVKDNTTILLRNMLTKERYLITRKEGELIVKKLVTCHSKMDGTDAKFELYEESDGSQRVIDLLPFFLEVSNPASKKVLVIDELDRSLHTLLTRSLLEEYLNSCSSETRSQLLLTTHDVLLMDQKLLRRDEMWVTERDPKGVSNIFSFSEYKDVRYDKDIRKSYLQGRMGGIPKILLRCGMGNSSYIQKEVRDIDNVEKTKV